MSKVIQVKLSVAGVNKAIRELEAYKSWFKERCTILLDRLAEEGYQIAQSNFSRAIYDGTNTVTVKSEYVDEHTRKIVAPGEQALFLEFGTGVTYPDVHPEASSLGMVRGSYGKHNGLKPVWYYYGEPGDNGRYRKTTAKGDLYSTKGNPPSMAMYETVKQLQARLPYIAKEVFGA